MKGQHVSFTQQVQQFADTRQQFILKMGEDAAADLISSSVIYISIGINDYIHYYLPNVSGVQSLYLPWGFNHFLASSLRQEIKVDIVARFIQMHNLWILPTFIYEGRITACFKYFG